MYKPLFIISLFFPWFSCKSQDINKYTPKETEYLKLFNSFTGYMKSCIKSKADISDSAHLKYIVLNYLFVDAKLDTLERRNLKADEITNEKLNNLKSQIKTFSNFLQREESVAENLTALPTRFAEGKFVYNSLSTFQRENTFVFFDKRFPKRAIGYILFMPPVERVISAPRIWSWILTYQYGKYMFRSVTGEEGYEYIFTPK